MSTAAQTTTGTPVPVTAENFTRAETDTYFAAAVAQNGFGRFHHYRELTPIDQQTVIRMNRDTLYSSAVFDLDAGPVTITLPDPRGRFMSLQIFDEDEYSPFVIYKPGQHVFRKNEIGTRYMMAALRTLVNPNRPGDLAEVHALQDATRVDQAGGGRFEIPHWEEASHKKVRDALLVLGDSLQDFKRAFGTKSQVDPVRFLIGAAAAWGGNPDQHATYINLTPRQNDGRTVHRMTFKDVPVDGFWSVSVYNARGYFEANPQNAYTINNLTATPGPDRSVTIQFGGCDGNVPNCLPITAGWNCVVRLYRPRPEILNGTWVCPTPIPMKS